jgi:hypothetical protein
LAGGRGRAAPNPGTSTRTSLDRPDRAADPARAARGLPLASEVSSPIGQAPVGIPITPDPMERAMLYTVANEGWAPGSPLPTSPRRVGLYRTRVEAESVAAGRPLVAVSVRFDASRGIITPASPAPGNLGGAWSAPAVVGPSGGVTALASIPASLVRPLGRPRLRVHAGHRVPGRPTG